MFLLTATVLLLLGKLWLCSYMAASSGTNNRSNVVRLSTDSFIILENLVTTLARSLFLVTSRYLVF